VLTSPTFFSLPHAAGKTLAELHAPVPGGDRLAARMARVFDHVRPGQVLERFNWTLQAGNERFTPDGAPLRARALAAAPEEAANLLHVRVERQTIAKLPDSGQCWTILWPQHCPRPEFTRQASRPSRSPIWES
jgi:hypothetical protein